MARVDVIVLNYNGRRFLKPCIEALRLQTYRDFELLLVDNGSTDDSKSFLAREFPDVRVLGLPRNVGFCGGNNRGIEATSGEYAVLLNNDTEAAPGWLEALVRAAEGRPDIGMCASKLVRLADRATIDTAGDVFYTHAVAGKRGSGEPSSRYTTPDLVFGACAGAALYRRSMLNEIGLLDEDFFAASEDIDLSFRAQLRGYRCQYVPEAVVYHHVGGHFGVDAVTAIRRVRRNMVDVVIKDMPGALLLKHLVAIVGYHAFGDCYYACRGYPLQVLLARWDNLRRLPRTLAKRAAIQRARRISTRELDAMLTPGGLKALGAAARRRARGSSTVTVPTVHPGS